MCVFVRLLPLQSIKVDFANDRAVSLSECFHEFAYHDGALYCSASPLSADCQQLSLVIFLFVLFCFRKYLFLVRVKRKTDI